MGVISNKKFKKLYGKDIFIYPFVDENLKGASYNLTVSRVAYYEEQDEKGNKKLVSALLNDNKIICKAKKIIHIQTEESIYVSERISGTYHSKVSFANKGLSSISTTLDPCYFGTSLISIVNLSENDIKIRVGETFCTLIFNELKSRAFENHDNIPFRKDISSGRIYDFTNLEEIKNTKIKHEIELYKNDLKENLEMLKSKKDCIEVEKVKLNKLETEYNYILLNHKNEIDNIQNNYKEKMVEWFENPIRRNKRELINRVRSFERERKKGKREKICLVISIVIFSLLFISLGYVFIKDIEEKEIEIIIGAITIYLTVLTLVNKKIIEFMLAILYVWEALVFRFKNIC